MNTHDRDQLKTRLIAACNRGQRDHHPREMHLAHQVLAHHDRRDRRAGRLWKKLNSTMFISSSTGKSVTLLPNLHDHREHDVEHPEEQQRLHQRPDVAEHRAEVGELVVLRAIIQVRRRNRRQPPPIADGPRTSRSSSGGPSSRRHRSPAPCARSPCRCRSSTEPDERPRRRRRCRRRARGAA